MLPEVSEFMSKLRVSIALVQHQPDPLFWEPLRMNGKGTQRPNDAQRTFIRG